MAATELKLRLTVIISILGVLVTVAVAAAGDRLAIGSAITQNSTRIEQLREDAKKFVTRDEVQLQLEKIDLKLDAIQQSVEKKKK